MKRMPQSGEIYYHFQKKLCQVIAIAEHSETKEQLVICQALQGGYGIYAYPLEAFAGEVDYEKYPDVMQNDCFTKVKMHEDGTFTLLEEGQASLGELQKVQASSGESQRVQASSDEPQKVQAVFEEPRRTQAEQASMAASDKSPTADDLLMQFLDAETMEEKYQVLVSMHNVITDRLIDNMAVVMDVVIPDGELTKRYDSLKYAVRTRQKYEFANRLR